MKSVLDEVNHPLYRMGYTVGYNEGRYEAMKIYMDEILKARSLRPIQYIVSKEDSPKFIEFINSKGVEI